MFNYHLPIHLKKEDEESERVKKDMEEVGKEEEGGKEGKERKKGRKGPKKGRNERKTDQQPSSGIR